MSQNRKIRYPEMRANLRCVVSSLSDVDHQKTKWGKLDPLCESYDDFDLAVSFIFDDASLGDAPNLAIGEILLDQMEATAISKLTNAISQLLEKYGNGLTDQEYLEQPLWKEIVNCADDLKTLLAREH